MDGRGSLCNADYLRFLDQLSAALEANGVMLYSYVLLSNHIHLQLKTPRGNLPRFMQRLTTACSMYFRYKKSRPGHCFQGRYGAKLVEGDDYLFRLTRYIHLNPVKAVRRCACPRKLAWRTLMRIPGAAIDPMFVWRRRKTCWITGG